VGGEPIIATKTYGKGRVVALGFVNAGLSPMIDWKVGGQQDDHWWGYLYSLLDRSIIWAAQREPGLTLAPLTLSEERRKMLDLQLVNSSSLPSAEVMADFWNEWGEKEGSTGISLNLKPGLNPATIEIPPNLSAGRHTVDVIVTADDKHYDWGSVVFTIPQPDEITSLATGREFYTRGEDLQVCFDTRSKSPQRYTVELFDNRGRLLARQKTTMVPRVPPPSPRRCP
jgi:hypothetical protein